MKTERLFKLPLAPQIRSIRLEPASPQSRAGVSPAPRRRSRRKLALRARWEGGTPALLFALLAFAAVAQDKPDLTNPRQRISYALGLDVVRVLNIDDFDINLTAIAAGMADMQAGKPALNREQQKIAMREMQEDILNKAVAKKEAAGEVHKKEGAAFLAANAKKEGVKIKECVAVDGAKAELQYKILKSGPPGPSPKKTDTVVVRYRGTLIDGTFFDLFDETIRKGDVATLPMTEVIQGWFEALQMMKVGDKWQLFVPGTLAYRDYGPPDIGIHTTLIYDLELLSFAGTDTNAPVIIR